MTEKYLVRIEPAHTPARDVPHDTREAAMIEFATAVHGFLCGNLEGHVKAYDMSYGADAAPASLIQHYLVFEGDFYNEMVVRRIKN